MLEPAAATTPVRIAERIAVHSDSRPARFVSAAMLLLVTGWLVLLVAHSGYLRHPDFDEILWPLTVLFCVGFIARGIFLGRPVTYGHAAWAGVAVVTALGANVLQFERAGEALVVTAGLILMWPTSARPQPEALAQVSALIDKTSDDPLAVFAMHSLKSYYFNADRSAAIAYRTRAGFAVVGGDPIGDESRFPALVRDFAAMCRSHGWRVAVLGCSEHALPLWTDSAQWATTCARWPWAAMLSSTCRHSTWWVASIGTYVRAFSAPAMPGSPPRLSMSELSTVRYAPNFSRSWSFHMEAGTSGDFRCSSTVRYSGGIPAFG